ncbi:DUF368 domain-containing protein [Clostridium saudiense]|nr:DUF368 domain-containing protein [Clostridium saudiense]
MRWVINFLKGIAISVATMVPGVSGGTMAIILNVYDDLIHAVGSFFEDWRKHSRLIFELALGGVAGVLIFSRIIDKALNTFPTLMAFFFIGVILGGIPTLYRKAVSIEKNNFNYIFLIVGFVLALFLSGGNEVASIAIEGTGIFNIGLLVLTGIIIAVALILPGISGSFILLILGLYDVTLDAINTFNIKFLIPVGIGVLIGIVLTTKIIEELIKKYPGKTYMMILGFVMGSIIAIYPSEATNTNIIYSILALIIGFAIIYFISKQDKE